MTKLLSNNKSKRRRRRSKEKNVEAIFLPGNVILTTSSIITTIFLIAIILLINYTEEISTDHIEQFISTTRAYKNNNKLQILTDDPVNSSRQKRNQLTSNSTNPGSSGVEYLSDDSYSTTTESTTDTLEEDPDIDLITTTTTISPLDSTTTTTSADEQEARNYCGNNDYNQRLPNQTLTPTHYDLIIMPDLTISSYEGAVQINLKILKETNEIILHADETLNVEEIYYLDLSNSNKNKNTTRKEEDLALANNNYATIKNVCRHPSKQLLVITLVEKLKANSNGLLHITFANDFNEDVFRGFYKSTYMNINESAKRYHAVTQFQATEARKVFPCFDEPIYKTTYDLTLIVSPSNRLVLANTRPILERLIEPNKERDLPERKLVKFARTPPMSTYLLAFIVGEFDYVENIVTLPQYNFTENNSTSASNDRIKKERKLRIRIYTPLDKQRQGEFALKVASRAIVALEKYFKIEYPLKKLDLVAIPDFEAGAMENWGLITFKTQQLLVDDSNTSYDSKALIAGTIIHELAHQWFGNLVTMKWWNDLWLNEGFATWIEYKLTGELYPKFEYNYYYLINSHIHGFNEDSYRQVHAIETQDLLEENQDIDQIFDAITYNKAAAVIKILHDDLYLENNGEAGDIIKKDDATEEDPFQKSLKVYLEKYKYNSTDMNDLCQSLVASSSSGSGPTAPTSTTVSADKSFFVQGKDVKKLLESWITQSGHPILKVNYLIASNELLIEQERFITGVSKLNLNETKQVWIIPVSIVLSTPTTSKPTSSRTEVLKFIMNKKRMNVKLPDWWSVKSYHQLLSSEQQSQRSSLDFSSHWLKVNSNFSGFYRVLYPIQLLALMKPAVMSKEMSPADRLNLIDEAHTLVISNKLTTDKLLELISWYSNENHGAVIEVLVGAYNGLLKIYEHQPKMAQRLILFGKKLLGSVYDNMESSYKEEEEKGLTYYLGKASLMSALVYLNHTKAVDDSLKLFHHRQDKYVPDLRRPVYMAVSKYGSDDDYKKLFDLFNKTDNREERARLANALAKANSLDRLKLTWSWLNKLDKDDLEDRFEILSSMLNTKNGRSFVLNLFDTNIQDLITLNDEKPINSLLEELSLSMDPNDFMPKLNHLFVRHRSSQEWRASLYYIRRMLIWQKATQERGSMLMEKSFEKKYLV